MYKHNTCKPINNIARLDVEKVNFAETYFVLFNDVQQNVTMVVRYVLVNGDKAGSKVAEVWVWFNDRNSNQEIAIKKQFPLAEANISKDKVFLEIGSSGIEDGRFWGDLDSVIEWEFVQHVENAIGIDRFPGVIKMTSSPQFYSPYCRHTVSGHVKFKGKLYAFDNVKATDGHYFGAKKGLSWNWGNALNFDEDPDFMFEGISIMKSPILPPSLWLYFYWQGRIYNCSGILNSMFCNKQTLSEDNRWRFTAKHGNTTFECEMSAKAEDMIMHYHPLENDKCIYTNIALNADMKIAISVNNKIEKILHSNQGAAFEVTRSYQNDRVKRNYQLLTNS